MSHHYEYIINYFNEHKLYVQGFSIGNNGSGMAIFTFSNKVGLPEIKEFQDKHSTYFGGCFYSSGVFAQTYVSKYIFDTDRREWCYFNKSVNSIIKDIKYWEENEKILDLHGGPLIAENL